MAMGGNTPSACIPSWKFPDEKHKFNSAVSAQMAEHESTDEMNSSVKINDIYLYGSYQEFM